MNVVMMICERNEYARNHILENEIDTVRKENRGYICRAFAIRLICRQMVCQLLTNLSPDDFVILLTHTPGMQNKYRYPQ
jgi:predicted MPP superfamily phosphohydrolase